MVEAISVVFALIFVVSFSFWIIAIFMELFTKHKGGKHGS